MAAEPFPEKPVPGRRPHGPAGPSGWSGAGPRTFNDILAVAIILGVPALWALARRLQLPGEAIGATIAVWTMVAQYYFRKRPTP